MHPEQYFQAANYSRRSALPVTFEQLFESDSNGYNEGSKTPAASLVETNGWPSRGQSMPSAGSFQQMQRSCSGE
jgi:hypothetical protein